LEVKAALSAELSVFKMSQQSNFRNRPVVKNSECRLPSESSRVTPRGIQIPAFSPGLAVGAFSLLAVTKINCDQFVHHKISEPRLIAAWLSGYYNAKRNNRVIDLQTFEENMSKVTNYCSDEKNFKVPVMKAVEQVLGGRK
jgi:hypothetical protein